MLMVAGREAVVDEAVDGGSLLDEIALAEPTRSVHDAGNGRGGSR